MKRNPRGDAVAPERSGTPPRPTPDPAWSIPQPETLPRPTWVPALMALGIVFLLWGIATIWLISAVGFVLFVAALAWWIGELRYGRG